MPAQNASSQPPKPYRRYILCGILFLWALAVGLYALLYRKVTPDLKFICTYAASLLLPVLLCLVLIRRDRMMRTNRKKEE